MALNCYSLRAILTAFLIDEFIKIPLNFHKCLSFFKGHLTAMQAVMLVYSPTYCRRKSNFKHTFLCKHYAI